MNSKKSKVEYYKVMFSKLFATKENIFLSDIGRGCVHICTNTGKILKTFEGFREPQGIYAREHHLYIADKLAGSVVQIDLQSGNRRVLADNLSSPSGLTGSEYGLQIAVAGTHQIWQIGYDGSNLTLLTDTLFAQPIDLDWLNDTLYVIDAKDGALRAIEYGRIETLCSFQHPEALCAGIGGCGNQRIFICDTFDGEVKVYDPLNGRVITLIEGLNHPTGICKADCWLYVVESEDILGRFDISSMEYERKIE